MPMHQNFINIRLDRLKYADLSLLYRGIEHIISEFDGEDLHLKIPFARYSEKSALLKSLETKDRSKYYADEYAKQLKRSDELVSALLLHLKALNRAAFPESLYIAESVYKFIRKALGNFVHVGADKKKAALDVIFTFANWLFILILLGGLALLFYPLAHWMHEKEGKWWPWPKHKNKKK